MLASAVTKIGCSTAAVLEYKRAYTKRLEQIAAVKKVCIVQATSDTALITLKVSVNRALLANAAQTAVETTARGITWTSNRLPAATRVIAEKPVCVRFKQEEVVRQQKKKGEVCGWGATHRAPRCFRGVVSR